jgi:hypothetical protein
MKSFIAFILLASSFAHANFVGQDARTVKIQKRTLQHLNVGTITKTKYFLCNPAGPGAYCDDQSLPKTQIVCGDELDHRIFNKRGERYQSFSVEEQGKKFHRIPLLKGESVDLGESLYICE